ncbi:hypothetical protein MMC32_003422 [Xylographa parallela]|nr:hypothetical protein [Xylographa parallela]
MSLPFRNASNPRISPMQSTPESSPVLRLLIFFTNLLIPPRVETGTSARRNVDVPVRVQAVLELVGALLACAVVAVLAVRLRLALAAVGVDVLAVVVLVVAGVLARVGDLAARVGGAVGALLGRVALEGVLAEIALDVVAGHIWWLDAAHALAVGIAGVRGAAWEHADVGRGRWANGCCGGGGVGSRAGRSADSCRGGWAALRRVLG